MITRSFSQKRSSEWVQNKFRVYYKKAGHYQKGKKAALNYSSRETLLERVDVIRKAKK